jgi:cytochrome P450
MGGKRICLGKTFADINMRLTIPLLLHAFNFELVSENYVKPPYGVGGEHEIVIPMKITVLNQL